MKLSYIFLVCLLCSSSFAARAEEPSCTDPATCAASGEVDELSEADDMTTSLLQLHKKRNTKSNASTSSTASSNDPSELQEIDAELEGRTEDEAENDVQEEYVPGAWGPRMNGYFVKEGHTDINQCSKFFPKEMAMTYCEQAADCYAIAAQNNHCSGLYRVTHGGPTMQFYPHWQSYNLHAFRLDRSKLYGGGWSPSPGSWSPSPPPWGATPAPAWTPWHGHNGPWTDPGDVYCTNDKLYVVHTRRRTPSCACRRRSGHSSTGKYYCPGSIYDQVGGNGPERDTLKFHPGAWR